MSNTTRKTAPLHADTRNAAHMNNSRLATWIYIHLFATSSKRKRTHYVLRAIITALILFGLLTVLSVFASDQTGISAVTVSRNIARGSTIQSSDISSAPLPRGIDESLVITSAEDVIGKTSMIDLSRGSFILQTAAQPSPEIPQGYTVIDVNLTSSTRMLYSGQHIQLFTRSSSAPQTEDRTKQHNIIAQDAIILSTATSQKKSQFWQFESSDSTNATLAVPADDAILVLDAQNNAPIIAIPAKD